MKNVYPIQIYIHVLKNANIFYRIRIIFYLKSKYYQERLKDKTAKLLFTKKQCCIPQINYSKRKFKIGTVSIMVDKSRKQVNDHKTLKRLIKIINQLK